jgi:hypothetical protein
MVWTKDLCQNKKVFQGLLLPNKPRTSLRTLSWRLKFCIQRSFCLSAAKSMTRVRAYLIQTRNSWRLSVSNIKRRRGELTFCKTNLAGLLVVFDKGWITVFKKNNLWCVINKGEWNCKTLNLKEMISSFALDL